MLIKFLVQDQYDIEYPEDIALFGRSEMVKSGDEENPVFHIVAEYSGDTLPTGCEELQGTLEDNINIDNEPTEIKVSKVRFLDLLGDNAVEFKVAIKTATDPVVQAKLEVAEQYMNASDTINLKSPKAQQFLQMLMVLNILDQTEFDLIISNTTLEESQG